MSYSEGISLFRGIGTLKGFERENNVAKCDIKIKMADHENHVDTTEF